MATKALKTITLVATFVSPGVAAGAAGIIIVGGKILKVGPRGPAFLKLAEAVGELSGKVAKTRTK